MFREKEEPVAKESGWGNFTKEDFRIKWVFAEQVVRT
jgi:hypothetical protein